MYKIIRVVLMRQNSMFARGGVPYPHRMDVEMGHAIIIFLCILPWPAMAVLKSSAEEGNSYLCLANFVEISIRLEHRDQ